LAAPKLQRRLTLLATTAIELTAMAPAASEGLSATP
jgi:hypothetical protein